MRQIASLRYGLFLKYYTAQITFRVEPWSVAESSVLADQPPERPKTELVEAKQCPE